MTREMVKQIERDYWAEKADPIDMAEVFDLAIKALEQEPQTFKWCDTCKEYDQEKHCCHRWSKVIRDTVEEMKQEPKTGYWITRPHIYGVAFCSECGFELKINDTNYCPNCGAKMSETGGKE